MAKRKCVVCRALLEKYQAGDGVSLLRFVRPSKVFEGGLGELGFDFESNFGSFKIVLDPWGILPGRGVSVCCSKNCLSSKKFLISLVCSLSGKRVSKEIRRKFEKQIKVNQSFDLIQKATVEVGEVMKAFDDFFKAINEKTLRKLEHRKVLVSNFLEGYLQDSVVGGSSLNKKDFKLAKPKIIRF